MRSSGEGAAAEAEGKDLLALFFRRDLGDSDSEDMVEIDEEPSGGLEMRASESPECRFFKLAVLTLSLGDAKGDINAACILSLLLTESDVSENSGKSSSEDRLGIIGL